MVTVRFTEDEAELTILALDYFRRHHLQEYDEESREEIAQQVREALQKLRNA